MFEANVGRTSKKESPKRKIGILATGMLILALIAACTSTPSQTDSTIFMSLRFTSRNNGETMVFRAPCQATIVEQDNYQHPDLVTGLPVSSPYRIISTTEHCATHIEDGFEFAPESAKVATASEIAAGNLPSMWEVYAREEVPSPDEGPISSFLLFLYKGVDTPHPVKPFRNTSIGGPCDISQPLKFLSQPDGFNTPFTNLTLTNVSRNYGPIEAGGSPLEYLSGTGSARQGDSGTGVQDTWEMTCAFAEASHPGFNYTVAIEYPDSSVFQDHTDTIRDRGIQILDIVYALDP